MSSVQLLEDAASDQLKDSLSKINWLLWGEAQCRDEIAEAPMLEDGLRGLLQAASVRRERTLLQLGTRLQNILSERPK